MILMTFITIVIVVKFDYRPALIQYIYCIVGKFGGGKAWRIGNLEVLARKSLANWESSFGKEKFGECQ